MTAPAVIGTQSSTWTQIGGSTASSTVTASSVTIAPTISERKAAGPSPTLNAPISSPQARHLSANRMTPAKRVFDPHRGQAPRSDAASREGSGVSDTPRIGFVIGRRPFVTGYGKAGFEGERVRARPVAVD